MIFYKVFEDSEALFVVKTRNIYKYSKDMLKIVESVQLMNTDFCLNGHALKIHFSSMFGFEILVKVELSKFWEEPIDNSLIEINDFLWICV